MAELHATDALLPQYLLLRNAVLDSRLSKGALMVLAVILHHRNRATGEAFPGIDKMSRFTRMHRTSHLRAIAELERAGYLQVERQQNRANRYTVTAWPENRDLPTGSTDATGSSHTTGSAVATGITGAHEPVASTHTDRSHSRTEPVAPVRPEPAFNLPTEPTSEPVEAPRKRGTRLPKDWMPDPSAQERLQAKHPGLDLETELEKFRDYWAASSSAKAVKADWQAAWRFWLRNAEEFAKRNPRAGKPAGAITRDTRSEEELEHHNFAELERFGLETAA